MAQPDPERLPLFPLGLVLFPGLLLPLHVFEERYRVMVGELLELPEDRRRFGVVAIREGREVGVDGVRALHEVGCVARLTHVQAHPDGRYDLVALGTERFRLGRLVHDRPYLSADVALLGEEVVDPAETGVLRAAVARSRAGYLAALTAAGADVGELEDLPADPAAAAYLVAATMLLDLGERQRLLACPGTAARLRVEHQLLRRESTLLTALRAVPAPDLARTPLSPN